VRDPDAQTVEQTAVGGHPPDAEESDATQVIEVPGPRARRVTDTAFDLPVVDDRPHMIPGFDRDEDDDTAVVADAASDSERTQVLPVAGAEADQTQVIPTEPPPGRPGPARGRPGPRKRR
jgi:hypothetical protein